MSEHTPGRIQLAKEFDGHIMTMDGLAVADCCLDYSSLDHDQQVSNARRLVACWNACDGIPTDELEPGEYEAHIIATGREIGRLEAQRDELLAELERERESRKTAQMRLHDEYERRSKTGLQHNMEKSRLMRQCDELLAALKVAISRQAYRPGEGPDWWEKGCAVIAKVEGGAA